MASNSDLNKPQFKINEILPEIFRSELNDSLFNNTTNRHLSKKSSVHVYGTIGKKNHQNLNNTRIDEDTVDRKTNQLQPLVYHKAATREYTMSMSDILNRLEHNGVDINRLPEWGDVDLFNFAPPINIDKFINYTNYYWYDPVNEIIPEYITIQNKLTVIRSQIIEKRKRLTDLQINNSTSGEIDILINELHALEALDHDIASDNFGWNVIRWEAFGWDNNDFSINNLNSYWGAYNNEGVSSVNNNNINSANKWVTDNKWLHKSDITDLTYAIRAEYPIIEYNSNLELNEWTYTIHRWKYRANMNSPWVNVDDEPTLLEMNNGINILNIEPVYHTHVQFNESNTWVIHHNLSHILLGETKCYDAGDIDILIDADNDGIYDGSDFLIPSSEYVIVNQTPTSVVITFNTPRKGIAKIVSSKIVVSVDGDVLDHFVVDNSCFISNTLYNNGWWKIISKELNVIGGTVITDITLFPDITEEQYIYENNQGYSNGLGVVYPYMTSSQGDHWLGFYNHWLYNGIKEVLPVNHQYENPNMLTYTFRHNGASEYYVNTPYFVGSNTLYVYVNGVRQYTNVYEVGNIGTISNMIRLDSEIFKNGDIFTVKTGAYAASDIGYEYVKVRISINEPINFDTDIVDACLIKYRKREQVKRQINQYPIFDIYNIDRLTAYEANSIFKYKQDNINGVYISELSQYIIPLSKDFAFEQLLVTDSGKLKAYKDYDTISQDNVDGLQLIWKNSNGVRYIPRQVDEYGLGENDEYFDSKGNIHTNTLVAGKHSWEMLPQLYYNYNHECRIDVNYTQLYKHFTTIIDKQTSSEFNYVTKGNLFKTLTNVDFSKGGTIKEHSFSFDTTVSTLLQEVVTPLTLLNYAASKYLEQLEYIKQAILNYLRGNILNSVNVNIVYNNVYDTLRLNDTYEKIFGDSTSHTIKNWIATLPILGFADAHVPGLYIDSRFDLVQILHHDGHRSDITFTPVQLENWVNSLIPNFNVVKSPAFPSLSNIPTRTVLYDDTASRVYRYNVKYIGTDVPTISAYKNGDCFYNSFQDKVYVLQNNIWQHTTDNTIIWTEVNIRNIIAEVVYLFEQKLYESIIPARYNISSLVKSSEYDIFNNYLYDEFISYTNSNSYNPNYSDFDVTNAFTYNYSNFAANTYLHKPYTHNNQWFARWYDIYEHYFNTRYPHLEPWRLQLFDSKPTWWDQNYKDTTGTRRWSSIMWNNIKQGILPLSISVNYTLPTYEFVCVNTYNTTIMDIPSDGLIPPYFAGINPASLALEAETFLRGSEINIANMPYSDYIADTYQFGENSIVEHAWRDSIFYKYHILKALYRLQPIKFIHTFFDQEFTNFNGLYVSKTLEKVYSHNDVVFHGDPLDSGTYKSNGLNQWYVNYLRSHNYDINISDFYNSWKKWSTYITYMTNSMIDSKSLQLSTRFYNIISNDYKVLLKKTPGDKDIHIPGFYVSVNMAGNGYYISGMESPAYENIVLKRPIGNGSDWVFDITFIQYLGPVYYYSVNHYSVSDISNNIITINGLSNWYDTTQVKFDNQYFTAFNTSKVYYVKALSNNQYKLAESLDDLEYGIYVDTVYTIKCIKANTTPTIFEPRDIWIHTVDGNTVVEQYNLANQIWEKSYGWVIKLPKNISNYNIVQIIGDNVLLEDTVHYIISGYMLQFLVDPITFTDLKILIPTDTNNLFIYEQVSEFVALNGAHTPELWKHYTVNDTVINTITSRQFQITGIQNVINFIDGFEALLKHQGVVFNNYEHSTDTDDIFGRVVSWQLEIEKLIDRIYVGLYGVNNTYTYTQNLLSLFHEVNPFKHNIWINHDKGMVSNILYGPYIDIPTQPIVYDQYGNVFLTIDNLKIYRNDLQTHILFPKLDNVADNTSHIGGLRLFFDSYEHAIVFNNYTINGNLVYDSFIGMNVETMQVSMLREAIKTSRPSHSGYYLLDNNSLQNIESTVDNIAHYYDAYNVDDSAEFIDYSRSLLDFNKHSHEYFSQLNVINKTKFAFYRGLIKHKGSTKSIDAILNHKAFEDAYLDEYWAIKIGEFGESREYSELFLRAKSTDMSVGGDIVYKFTNSPIIQHPRINVYNDDVYRWQDMRTYSSILKDNYRLLSKMHYIDNSNNDQYTFNAVTTLPYNATDVTSNIRTIQYTTTTAGRTFTITNDATVSLDSTHTIVYVDGVKQQPQSIISFDQQTITFANQLPVGSNIVCDYISSLAYRVNNTVGYFETHIVVDEPLTTLVLNNQYVSGSNNLLVYINGVKQTIGVNFSYVEIDNNTIKFNTPVPINAIIDIVILKILSPGFLQYKQAILSVASSTITLTESYFTNDNITNINNAFICAFVQGVRQEATILPNGITITLNNAAQAGDIVEVYVYHNYTFEQLPNLVNVSLTYFVNQFEYLLIFLYDDIAHYVNVDIDNNIPLPYYIDSINVLNVYVNGVIVDIISIIDGYTIKINPTSQYDIIKVVYKPQLLQPGVDYDIVNNQCIKFYEHILYKKEFLKIYSYEYDVTKHNILKLLSNTLTISDIFYYNPLRGYYHPQVLHNVDFISDNDPAVYTNSTTSIVNNNIWNSTEKDLIWWNTKNLKYIPYVDRVRFNRLPDILQNWGQKQDWCTVDVFQWTESDLHPLDWEEEARRNVSNIEGNTIHGSVYKKYYYRSRSTPTSDWSEWIEFEDTHIVSFPYLSNMVTGGNYVIYFNDDLSNPNMFTTTVDNIITERSNVQVYRNGIQLDKNIDYYIVYVDSLVDSITINYVDVGDEIRIVVSKVLPTQEDVDNALQDVDSLYQYIIETPYTEIITYDSTGVVPKSTYYFWVTDRIYKADNKLSVVEIKNLILSPSDPYYFVESPVNNEQIYFDELIIRNMKYKITDDVNYQFLLPTNFTVHERFDETISLQKNAHTEWLLFRQRQIDKINEVLWNKVIETIIGKSLIDNSLVPSLQYVVYDNLNNENTKIGFGVYQCLGEKNEVFNIFINDILDPNNDYMPINKEVFLDNYDLTSEQGIIEAMTHIYQYGKSEDINRVFFKILHNAYATTNNLRDIIKTSMVSVYNLQYFETPDRVIHD